uniref:Phospholipid/glycerol acyltransferase domain-containing protein n=1 Tax=Sexangularia sp. CB-2014 TaxID=1486929 RepID=A0A7S1YL07_9EUKA
MNYVLSYFAFLFVKFLSYTIAHCFFSHIEVSGSLWKHEQVINDRRKMGTIYIANHSNQFHDAALLLVTVDSFLGIHSFWQSARISFICAAVTLRKKLIGGLAAASGAIGVERPQDVTTAGVGVIVGLDVREDDVSTLVVRGRGSNFTSTLLPGAQIRIDGCHKVIRIAEVMDDERALATTAGLDAATVTSIVSHVGSAEGRKYTVIPKLNHRAMFTQVWDLLGAAHGSLGVFPEGGSTDNTDLLPLKAGVAIMALGSVAKHRQPVRIIPVGLNYSDRAKFRSTVLVQYGVPMVVEYDDAVRDYLAGGEARNRAVTTLLAKIESSLRDVIVTCPDRDTRALIKLCRRLYVPPDSDLSVTHYLELERRFATGIATFSDHPSVQALKEQGFAYMAKLRLLGIRDSQLDKVDPSYNGSVTRLSLRIAWIMLLILVGGPLLFVGLPIAVYARTVSRRKAREAAARSTVKIDGMDVIASQKVLVSLVTVPLYYSAIALYLLVRGFPSVVREALPALHFSLPVLAATLVFLTVKALPLGELIVAQARLVIPLLRGLVSGSYAEEFRMLRQERAELRNEITQLVEQLGPVLIPDFDKTRIISAEAIALHLAQQHARERKDSGDFYVEGLDRLLGMELGDDEERLLLSSSGEMEKPTSVFSNPFKKRFRRGTDEERPSNHSVRSGSEDTLLAEGDIIVQ